MIVPQVARWRQKIMRFWLHNLSTHSVNGKSRIIGRQIGETACFFHGFNVSSIVHYQPGNQKGNFILRSLSRSVYLHRLDVSEPMCVCLKRRIVLILTLFLFSLFYFIFSIRWKLFAIISDEFPLIL